MGLLCPPFLESWGKDEPWAVPLVGCGSPQDVALAGGAASWLPLCPRFWEAVEIRVKVSTPDAQGPVH